MKWLIALLLILTATSLGGQAASQSAPIDDAQTHAVSVQPKLVQTGRVTDVADILDDGQEAALSQRLKIFEQATGHQLVIVTVNALDGQDVADFTRELANAWGVGRVGHDDGVVLLIAPNERRVRIAVGYGLEPILTNACSQKIIDKQILPHFLKGNFPRGIKSGIIAIIDQLQIRDRGKAICR